MEIFSVFLDRSNIELLLKLEGFICRNPLDSSINFFSPNGRRPRVAGSPDIPKQDFVRVSRSFGIYQSSLKLEQISKISGKAF